MKYLKTGSVVTNELPEGCKYCQRGLKLVLFITGLCPRKCFYCPLSENRRGKDLMFANERPISNIKEAIEEAILMDSEGVGITGGDPLVVFKRTVKFIRELKRFFGKEYHVHLYTSGIGVNKDKIRELYNAGLDEIRFHPPFRLVRQILKIIEMIDFDIDIGFEIPSLPDQINTMKELVKMLDKSKKVKFLNINELEFSESNSLNLLERGYELKEGSLVAVKGSEEAAIKVIKWAEYNGISLNIHYCPSIIKDRYQTKLRLYRRGIRIAKIFDQISDDGTIIRVTLNLKGENKWIISKPFIVKINRKIIVAPNDDFIEELLREGYEVYLEEYLPEYNEVLVCKEKITLRD